MYSILKYVAVLMALFLTFVSAADAPEDIDLTFGGTGYVTTPIKVNDNGYMQEVDASISDTLVDHNDYVTVVGVAYKSIALARYTPTGALDPTFGSGGIVTTDFTYSPNHYLTASFGENGKILVLVPEFSRGMMIRYNNDGSLDTTFDQDGILNETRFTVADVITASNGKIYAAVLAAGGDFTLIRYNDDGTHDLTFGIDGFVKTDFNNGSDYASVLTEAPDGKLLVGGHGYGGYPGEGVGLARYNLDGALDTTFGVGGKVVTDLHPLTELVKGIKVDNQGKIFVLLTTHTDEEYDPAILITALRYNPDGSLDTSFAEMGKIIGDGVASAALYDLDFDVDAFGRLIISSTGSMNTNQPGRHIFLLRYNPDGTHDLSFGDAGLLIDDIGGVKDNVSLSAIAIDSQNRIVGGGSFDSGYLYRDFMVIRYINGMYSVPAVNVLRNGGFEQKVKGSNQPLKWSAANISDDRVVCNRGLQYHGVCAYRFKGGATENSRLSQTVNLEAYNLVPGDRIVLTATLLIKKTQDFKGQLMITYLDGSTEKVNVPFAWSWVDYYAFSGKSVTLTKPVKSVKVRFINQSFSNLLMDDVKLFTVPLVSGRIPN